MTVKNESTSVPVRDPGELNIAIIAKWVLETESNRYLTDEG